MAKVKSTRLSTEDLQLFEEIKHNIEKDQYGVVNTDSKVFSLLIRYYHTHKIKGNKNDNTSFS